MNDMQTLPFEGPVGEYFEPWRDAILPLFEGGQSAIRRTGGTFHCSIYPSKDQALDGREIASVSVTVHDFGKYDLAPVIARAIADLRQTDARWL
jgi:hypothetical protein